MSATATRDETDRSTALQQGTREFSGFYERHAYLIYNLTLRVTVDREAAIDAACAAFLASLGSETSESQLVALAVRRSLPVAHKKPTVEAAGDPEAQAMLRAAAALAPPERAALALVGLTKSDPAEIGNALQTGQEAAKPLIERAWRALTEAAQMPRERVEESYQSWLWAEPPPELWERLYPSFYAQLVRRLNSSEPADDPVAASAATAVLAAAPKPTRRERRRARQAEWDALRKRPAGRLRKVRRTLLSRRMALVGLLAAAGVGGAYAAGAFGGSSDLPSNPYAYAPAQKLSPAEIARLRAQEQQASRNYAQQQLLAQRAARQQQLALRAAGSRLRSPAGQSAAKRRQQALQRARAAALRQRQLQAQLQAQSQQPQAQSAPAPPAYQAPPPTHSPSSSSSSSPSSNGGSHSGGGGSNSGSAKQTGGSGPPNSGQAQQQCLYNANDGTYVCPQN